MAQLAQGLGFDLADALAGDVELLAHFFQPVVGVHVDAEAHAQDLGLARGQAGQHVAHGFGQVDVDGGLDRDSTLVSGLGQIVAVVAMDPPQPSEDLLLKIAAIVPPYMVPRRVIILDFLPKNANGKVERIVLQSTQLL